MLLFLDLSVVSVPQIPVRTCSPPPSSHPYNWPKVQSTISINITFIETLSLLREDVVSQLQRDHCQKNCHFVIKLSKHLRFCACLCHKDTKLAESNGSKEKNTWCQIDTEPSWKSSHGHTHNTTCARISILFEQGGKERYHFNDYRRDLYRPFDLAQKYTLLLAAQEQEFGVKS